MNIQALGQVTLYLVVLFALAQPLGRYLVAVLEKGLPAKAAGVESKVFALFGIKSGAAHEMNWIAYAVAIILFNLFGVLAVFGIQMLQGHLPFNPQHFGAPTWDSALNTAVSFVTNTNWQGYAGESTMSHFTQMTALTVQNFVSAATGLAVAFALIRGFVRRSSKTLGNAWVDLWRGTIYVLIPLSIIIALLFAGQGVIQNFSPDVTVTTLQGAKQTLAMGPVASQEAIMMVGTNGGGFFNANAAHPFSNPTPFSNFIHMLSIFLIPAALCFALGRMSGDQRQGGVIVGAMTLMFVVAFGVAVHAELAGNPLLTHTDQVASVLQAGGNMEGKETRFGVVTSSLFTVITTAASCGAVNNMHDSLTPVGGLVAMLLIQLGEVVFGGVGSGLYGMLLYAILAVFIAGLMIGRTPEYLGKKIEAFDMKMVVIGMLVTPLIVLVGTAIAVMTEAGRAGIANPQAHGFSEILYAFSSAANNNGSAFGGLSANTPFYNLMLAFAMFFGRFGVILPVLALAGSLANKQRLTATSGTLPTHTLLFVFLLVGTVILVGALTYVPALALGPIVEQVQLALHAVSGQ
ncbi:potassium-transporting ATPase subunit KdpA [Aquirhabdus parva]|uniref:Potassium-transporting ATPase potassium-binding subunit n=1 Tax=Aquirhabdus parva TaxID=2283318 RepID=A0A345P461_9GAMM|nr:potassium-transporting ATPase subunit KdpA [Aquirhabdus parva]AXI02070.1 potassium-transporting ATPase subunit KdpA [Aquirhabdus parva]